MKKHVIHIVILVGLIGMLLSACSKPGGKFGGMNREVAPSSVIIEVVQPRDLEEYIKVVGTLEGITDITLTSEVSGKITEVCKNLGDWVDAGEAIGSIDNADLQNMVDRAKASMLAAEASYEQAQLNMTTSEKLYNDEQISKASYLEARINHKSAQANLEAAKATLASAERALRNSLFTAPVSGFITSINLEIGEMIGAGVSVCTIVNTKQLIVKTGVGEGDILLIKKGQQVSIHPTDNGHDVDGIISGVGIKPLSGTANYPIEIILDNEDNLLLPGMVVEGFILARIYEDVVYTSLNNISEKYDDKYVYIIDDENTAHQVFIELGKEVDRNVVIEKGLTPDDRLVREGYENLQEGTKVSIKSVYQPETSK